MNQYEVVARTRQQAIERTARKYDVPAADISVAEEFDPDEQDLEQLRKDEEEEGLSEEEREGEPVLYLVKVGVGTLTAPVEEWVGGLVERFQPGATCQVVPASGDRLRAVLSSPEPSILIGRAGQTLAALQHIVGRIIPRVAPDAPPVILDVGDYVERKEERLETIAVGAAERVARQGRSASLRPMSSSERKFIHRLLKSYPGVVTQSVGREPRRYVMISPEGAQPAQPPRRDEGRSEGRSEGKPEGGGSKRGRFGKGGGKGERRQPEKGKGQKKAKPDQEEIRRTLYGSFEGEEGPEHSFEDSPLDEKTSLLPRYREEAVDEGLLSSDRELVDEIDLE